LSRADIELVARGLAPSRTAAQRLIADGAVFTAAGARVTRASQQLTAHDELSVAVSDETRFVSRAGAKLDHVLRATGVVPGGLQVLDLGMSTGGFADCLLQAGARRVVGIEVGHDQLHARLRDDPRIVCLERTNLRDVDPALLHSRVPDVPADGFPMAVADLSFISLTKVLPVIDALLAPDATALLLVKPQFEVGPQGLDRRGIVTDPLAARAALEQVANSARSVGWTVLGLLDSAVPGSDGNREFFLHARVDAQRLRSSANRS
jgi:23S rRNA (cytidine1920-2'-O)/16S rRNA (cytidine1409-2'-O)-methyltransferase